MPVDSKRINAPTSVPYHLHSVEQFQSYETRLQNILAEDEKRRDGRSLREMRKICK